MEGLYSNSTSQDQSFNHSNITSNYQDSNTVIDLGDYYKVKNIMYVLTCIIIGIDLPLTLVAIYALYSMVRSDHVAPIYVINLLIADILKLCSMIIDVTPNNEQINAIFLCIYHFGLVASVYFMVCIALERYLVIAHPLWYRCRRTIKSSVVLCVLVWVLSLLSVCVVLFVHVVSVVTYIINAVLLLLPFPLLIFFLTGTIRALSASISVPSDEKRRTVGVLVLVLLIYTLLFLPSIMVFLDTNYYIVTIVSQTFVRLNPLEDLFLYVFMRKGTIDKLLASVCCCRMDSNDISSPSV